MEDLIKHLIKKVEDATEADDAQIWASTLRTVVLAENRS